MTTDRVRAKTLSKLFEQNQLVIVPSALSGTEGLPSVTLGPHTGIELDEFLSMVRGLGANGVYMDNASVHFEALTENSMSREPLVVQCVIAGVLHTWTNEDN